MITSPLEGNLRVRSAASLPRGSRVRVRDQILETALEEFADKGYQEASLSVIARRVGVTAPLLLYHFGSKSGLWREALGLFCSNFGAMVDRAVTEGEALDGREALQLLVRRLVYFFATNRAAYRLVRDEGVLESDQGDGLSSGGVRPVIERIKTVYVRAVAEGAVRSFPFETTLFMILGAVSCYLESRPLAGRLFGSSVEGEDWLSAYADQVVGLCFEGLSVPSPTRLPRSRMVAIRTVASSEDNGRGAGVA